MNTNRLQYDKATLGPCEEFKGPKTPYGYGHLRHNGKKWYAHRLAWTQVNGEIPPKMFVCHKCDNPACIRLDHLFLGTAKDNYVDALKKGRAKHDRQRNEKRTRQLALQSLHNAIIRANRRRFVITTCAKRGHMTANTIEAIRQTTKHATPLRLIRWAIQELTYR